MTASRRALTVLAVLVVAAVTIVAVRVLRGLPPLPFTERSACTVDGTSYEFSNEQAANASTISAVALGRALPERAVTVALATSMQESKLENLDHGDRDSLGLFQQRPSQGWGTPAQLMDPRYAAGKFYDALVKVPDWQTIPLTAAAQAVQQSGFPGLYAKWERRATALAHALVGGQPAGLRCEFPEPDGERQSAGASGLTPRAANVAGQLRVDFPSARVAGGHDTAVEVGPASWAVASWLVANAERLDVSAVSFQGRRWERGHGDEAWSDDDSAPSSTVHVEVPRGG